MTVSQGGAETTNVVGFLLVVRPKGIFFNPWRKEGMEFEVDTPMKLRFIMKPANPEQDGSGMHGMECTVTTEIECASDDYKFIDSIINRKFIPFPSAPINLPYSKRGEIKIDSEGNFADGYYLPLEGYPKSVQDLYLNARMIMENFCWRVLTNLRWIQNAISDAEPYEHVSMYWKTTQEVAHAVRRLHSGSNLTRLVGVQWDKSDRDEFLQVWDLDANEPLSHQLLREAKELSASSPRSCLLMLATALEVSAKQYISKFAPQTALIMQKMPSPPIFRLFREVIPDIHKQVGSDLGFFALLKPLFKTCIDLFEDRNRLAHAGEFTISSEKLDIYVTCCSDLLYIIDSIDGNEWAKTKVSYEISKLLGWPSERNGMPFVRVMEEGL